MYHFLENPEFSLSFQFLVAILLPIVIAQRGLKKKSLSTSGAIAGVLVAFFTVICHWGFLFGKFSINVFL